MNAVPSQKMIAWAEALGEAIGRGIANQLRGQVARIVAAPREAAVPVSSSALAPATAPRRRGRPPGSKNKVRDPSAAPRRRGLPPRLAPERVDGYKLGDLVKYKVDDRLVSAEIIGIDALAGQLLIRDAVSGAELRRPPSQVHLPKAGPVQVRKRRAPVPAPVLVPVEDTTVEDEAEAAAEEDAAALEEAQAAEASSDPDAVTESLASAAAAVEDSAPSESAEPAEPFEPEAPAAAPEESAAASDDDRPDESVS